MTNRIGGKAETQGMNLTKNLVGARLVGESSAHLYLVLLIHVKFSFVPYSRIVRVASAYSLATSNFSQISYSLMCDREGKNLYAPRPTWVRKSPGVSNRVMWTWSADGDGFSWDSCLTAVGTSASLGGGCLGRSGRAGRLLVRPSLEDGF